MLCLYDFIEIYKLKILILCKGKLKFIAKINVSFHETRLLSIVLRLSLPLYTLS